MDVETGSNAVVETCEKLKQMGNVCEAKIYEGTGHAFTHESRYGGLYPHPGLEAQPGARTIARQPIPAIPIASSQIFLGGYSLE